MKNDTRRQALFIILISIVFIMVLGISLPELTFQPALPFPGASPDSGEMESPQSAKDSSINSSPWVLQIGLAVGIVLIVLALLIALYKKVKTKHILILAGSLVVLFVFFSILPNLPGTPSSTVQSQTDSPEPAQFDYLTAPIGEPPEDMLFWVKIIVLLTSIFLVGWLVMSLFKRSPKENPLAVEAESAIQALSGGEDLGKVIIKCYLNMERIISQERGIDRDYSMTPREFEINLISKGIPREPIQQLTSLFEKARYGIQILTEQDELDALNCLSAIQKACQIKKQGDQ